LEGLIFYVFAVSGGEVIRCNFCRYASAIERNPDDHDALYNWALILQVWFLFVII